MFGWFRRAVPVRDTSLAMVDPRPGNSVLVLGATDPQLTALCGAATGLNGRTVVTGRTREDEQRITDAARAEGALVEFVTAPPAMLPFDSNSFDIVVIPHLPGGPGDNGASAVAEAVRVMRPAGRLIVITGQKRAGVFGALQTAQPLPAPEAIIAMLSAAGTVAARKLAAADGRAYFESRKPRM
jgi:SAM-dependent methyltransferase